MSVSRSGGHVELHGGLSVASILTFYHGLAMSAAKAGTYDGNTNGTTGPAQERFIAAQADAFAGSEREGKRRRPVSL